MIAMAKVTCQHNGCFNILIFKHYKMYWMPFFPYVMVFAVIGNLVNINLDSRLC